MGFAAWGRAWWGRALHRWCASLPVCLLALAGLALLLPGAARAEAVLRVLARPGYADPDFVAVFEKRHGVKVEITTVASDDVLRARWTPWPVWPETSSRCCAKTWIPKRPRCRS